MTASSRRSARLCALFTLCFSLLAHGYRYLSMGFSGDAMLLTQEGEAAFQIALGRFLQPVYWMIRGHITAPLTIGLFATAFLAVSAAITAQLLGITRPLHIALVCGAMVTNETLAASNATYLPWTDVYALSLMLSLLGVYVFSRRRRGWLLSPLFFCLSLGLYQSYITSAATLFILLLIARTLDGERPGTIWPDGIRACVSLVAGLLLYALVLRAVLAVTGTQASNEYNGVGRVSFLTADKIPALVLEAYCTPLVFLFDLSAEPVMPWHAALIPGFLHAALCIAAAPMLLAGARRLRLLPRLTLLFLLAVLPLGMNFVQVISEGIVSGLMIYAYFLSYALVILLLARTPDGPPSPGTRISRLSAAAATLVLAVIFCININASNQMAVKRDLEYSATTSAMARLIDQAEQTEGYVPGETPVVINGTLPTSSISMVRSGFEEISLHQGMRYTYAASYEDATRWYLQMALGEPLCLVDPSEPLTKAQQAALDAMPAFPLEGCCRMVEGCLIIKIS